ncbi:class I SAM-dependent methyltransferase [Streptomyces sp. NPDC050161]|uniref:class I SAM-dependent methyltransferase n=1 Tax=Streptomyces sp. NPDC050161 TaxID=3365604 RepID=UPI0037B48C40
MDHYTSKSRRDPVKRLWEEPVTRSILAEALDHIGPREPVRIMDVGCGTGEGLRLLSSLDETKGRALSYCGLDMDRRLLEIARTEFADHDAADFIYGDMRGGIPDSPYELYLSCGVPYSHLAPEELPPVLAGVFRSIKRNRTRSTVVVDVLGRYSLEWMPRWGEARWDYRMSFFRSDQSAGASPMTFWSPADLLECIGQACREAEFPFGEVNFRDRSIMVGRHTETGEFNPALAPYRALVNRLEAGTGDVIADDLRFPDTISAAAPEPVAMFYRQLRERWNAVIEKRHHRHSPPTVSAAAGRYLARELRELEHQLSPGLGVGHSLTAIIHFDPYDD